MNVLTDEIEERKNMRTTLGILLTSMAAWAQAIPIASLETKKLDATAATYQGKQATCLSDREGGGGLALLKGSVFKNGVIEVELAGKPSAGAFAGARGFVGIAFRAQSDGSKYECIYLRPTNGRADDMERRNHSTQYISERDWPWDRLRKESPGVYESYVDLEAGAWTRYKIVVKGARAELYVHDAAQPCLIVKDLKLGDGSRGALGRAGHRCLLHQSEDNADAIRPVLGASRFRVWQPAGAASGRRFAREECPQECGHRRLERLRHVTAKETGSNGRDYRRPNRDRPRKSTAGRILAPRQELAA